MTVVCAASTTFAGAVGARADEPVRVRPLTRSTRWRTVASGRMVGFAVWAAPATVYVSKFAPDDAIGVTALDEQDAKSRRDLQPSFAGHPFRTRERLDQAVERIDRELLSRC